MPWALIAVAAFGAGVVFGSWDAVEFERKVNLTDLLTLLLTVALTVYVVVWGEKRFGEDRAEKDLLIDAVGGVREALADVDELFKGTYRAGSLPDQRGTLAALEELGYALGDLKGLAEDAGHDRASRAVGALLEGEYIRLRKVLTGGDFPSKPYTPGVNVEARQAFAVADAALRKLVFTVNRK